MSNIPEPNHSTLNAIELYHEQEQTSGRPHMGCSLLGHKCDRYLWLNFRHAGFEQFSGRMLRLFRRGQNEEAVIVSDLRAIGCEVADVDPETGDQLRVDFGNHISGSMDGIVFSGVIEAPKKKHVLEIKTHNKSSFNQLEKNGVKDSKPLHYGQMQLYMLGTDIDRALYTAVCKDDDRYYFERVRFDRQYAQDLLDRGNRIVSSDRMPEPLSSDPSWYECKFCNFHDFCHGSKITKEVNCRTCCHSTPKQNSTWHCEKWQSEIPYYIQRSAQPCHAMHPDLVPYKMAGSKDEWTPIYIINGKEIANGENDTPSTDIVNGADDKGGNAIANEAVQNILKEFDGKIV